MGYILGKVEERPVNPAVRLHQRRRREQREREGEREQGEPSPLPHAVQRSVQRNVPTERVGHITSLAVHSHARRLGVTSSLIRQLHYHLAECYRAESIGLHVRISNEAAVRLYCDDGYDVADIIPAYYHTCGQSVTEVPEFVIHWMQ